MNEGDRLQERFRLTTLVPSRDVVEQWRAVDESTSAEVDVLVLTADKASPEARSSFREVHEVLTALAEARADEDELGSAVVIRIANTISVSEEGTSSFAVRDYAGRATLADVAGPLEPPLVAAIGAMLAPAVLAAGPAVRGALLPSDIALDSVGWPVLAPRGAPLNRAVRSVQLATAPEAYDGTRIDGPAGLYGLGVVLYRLVTGREPVLGGAGAPPPTASSIRSGVPLSLDVALQQLMSRTPADRVAAVQTLRELAGPLKSLHPYLRQQPASAAPKARPTPEAKPEAPSRNRLELVHSPAPAFPAPRPVEPLALVVVPPARLRSLDAAQRNLAAGLAGVPAHIVERLQRDRLPLVIEQRPSPAQARHRALTLGQETGLPVGSTQAWPVGPWIPFTSGLGFALVPILLASAMFAIGLPEVAGALVALGISIVGVGTMATGIAGHGRAIHAAGVQAMRRMAIAERGADALAPAWARLTRVRLRVAEAELPDNAAADILDSLALLEARLDVLARRANVSRSALTSIDDVPMRTRLALLEARGDLDERDGAERDRLRATLQDLDALAERRRRIAEGLDEIQQAMTELEEVLAMVGGDPSDDVLAQLARATSRITSPTVPQLLTARARAVRAMEGAG